MKPARETGRGLFESDGGARAGPKTGYGFPRDKREGVCRSDHAQNKKIEGMTIRRKVITDLVSRIPILPEHQRRV